MMSTSRRKYTPEQAVALGACPVCLVIGSHLYSCAFDGPLPGRVPPPAGVTEDEWRRVPPKRKTTVTRANIERGDQ